MVNIKFTMRLQNYNLLKNLNWVNCWEVHSITFMLEITCKDVTWSHQENSTIGTLSWDFVSKPSAFTVCTVSRIPLRIHSAPWLRSGQNRDTTNTWGLRCSREWDAVYLPASPGTFQVTGSFCPTALWGEKKKSREDGTFQSMSLAPTSLSTTLATSRICLSDSFISLSQLP